MHSDSSGGKWQKLLQGKFCLGMKKIHCENDGTSSPKAWWHLPCWKYPTLGVLGPWITRFHQKTETHALQRAFPTWIFPSLCDPMGKAFDLLSFDLEVRFYKRKTHESSEGGKKKVCCWALELLAIKMILIQQLCPDFTLGSRKQAQIPREETHFWLTKTVWNVIKHIIIL